MLSKVGKYEFLSEPFHCDFTGRLFMGHLGNHLLNAADFHSNHRGFGMNYLMPIHKTWVLSRLAIEMEEMPVQYSKFNVETWVESAMRFFTNRNFRIVDAEDENEVYGYGRSVWAMIDTDSRQPQNILDIRNGEIVNYIESDKPCPMDKGGRVAMSDKAEFIRSIDTYYNDIDINGHVNSIKYIEHVLDLWNVEWYRKHTIKRFEIAYVAESYQGDKLSFYREQVADNEYCVRIMRTREGDEQSVEVCRSKVVFHS